jgi:hypothetical protein
VPAMRRLTELIGDVRVKFPEDDFFKGVEVSWQWASARDQYAAYENVFGEMDAKSWQILKNKAIAHFEDEREGQKKQAFFNVLNEAFAYHWLLQQGFSEIKILPEDGKPTPDISYIEKDEKKSCEVKTIGISDDEIARRSSRKVYDGSPYLRLSSGFINMLRNYVGQARKQIHAVGQNGLAYILIRFDDIALDYYERYRNQLADLCQRENFSNLILAQHSGTEILRC